MDRGRIFWLGLFMENLTQVLFKRRYPLEGDSEQPYNDGKFFERVHDGFVY